MLLEDIAPNFFYHGTSTALGIDKVILPPEQTEKLSEVGRKKNLNKVFFTRDLRSAEAYAHKAVKNFGGNPVIYKVKPVGHVDVLQATPGTSVFMADAAEILSSELRDSRVKVH